MTVSPYFENVPGIGNLELDEILVDYDYPLLSVLKSRSGQRFLCMCYDVRGEREKVVQDWIMTPVATGQLKALLRNEITLDAPFKTPGEKILVQWRYAEKRTIFTRMGAELIPESCLPAEGEYLDAEPDEWDEYIAGLEGGA